MKSVLNYLILVGLPVCGVLLILRAGQSLKAPSSIGGAWAVEVSAPLGCGASAMGSEPPVLIIAQSGPHLNLTLNSNPPTILSGVIEAAQVTASQTEGASQSAAPVYLEATLDSQAVPDQLSGQITLAGCSTSLPFTATRRPPSE